MTIDPALEQLPLVSQDRALSLPLLGVALCFGACASPSAEPGVGSPGVGAGGGAASAAGSAGAGAPATLGQGGAAGGGTGGTGTGGVLAAGGGGAASAGGIGAAGAAPEWGKGAPAGSPVALNGTLTASGNRIVGSHGDPVQLKGMSLFWSQHESGAAFYDHDVVSWLVEDWQIGIIRIAIAVTGEDDGDYLSDPQGQLGLLDQVVQAAFDLGIYALIDWHDHHANEHVEQAKAFFATVSERYGDRPNVLYEIWNEPRGNQDPEVTWSGVIKPYAQSISQVIRQHDAANLMIVGTPFWDQRPNDVVDDEVDDPNVAYTLHFYAGSESHWFGGELGAKAKAALDAGIPLFVTEWGTTHPSDQAIFNEAESRVWMDFLDQNAISSCNWSITSKDEGSSAIQPWASPQGQWSDEDLSRSGRLVRELIRGF